MAFVPPRDVKLLRNPANGSSQQAEEEEQMGDKRGDRGGVPAGTEKGSCMLAHLAKAVS